MANRLKSGQSGLSVLGMLFIGTILALGGVLVIQIIPTLIEYQAVHRAVKKAASEGSTVPEVRTIFDRTAQIDDIKSISGKDLVITRSGDASVVSFAYQREVHLAGPVWLTLKYQGSSK